MPRILKHKTCFFFDLDDTLHNFRGSSNKATQAVCAFISARTGLSQLQIIACYKNILASATSSHFVEGYKSSTYRQKRFEALLAALKRESLHNSMPEILNIYEDTWLENLRLLSGAQETLAALQAQSLPVYIVSEGPHDAQERALNKLNISQYVTRLITSNKLGLSKSDGLYQETARLIDVDPEQIIIIGDSWERDIVPAKADGFDAIWVNDNKSSSKNDVLQISSLSIVAETLSSLKT